MQATKTKSRTHDNAGEIKLESGFALRFFVLPLLLLVAWFVSDGKARPRFSGSNHGGNDGTLRPLDTLTKKEREQIGGIWEGG